MRTFLLTFLFLLVGPCVFAQANQIEANFVFHPNWERKPHTNAYGVGVELTSSIGKYVKLINSFSYENDTYKNPPEPVQELEVYNYTLHNALRFYPIEGSLKPFVQGGIRARNSQLRSNTTLSVLDVNLEVYLTKKNTFISPHLGFGLNYKDVIVGSYSYVFSDFASSVNVDQFSYRERGHLFNAKGYVPIGKKWNASLGFQLYRNRFELSSYANSYSFTYGLAYKI